MAFGWIGKAARAVARKVNGAVDVAADLARAIRGILPGKSRQVADVVIEVDAILDAAEKKSPPDTTPPPSEKPPP